jgi:four helix bundle protein
VKIERFEDIKAWQEARALVKGIYDATKSDRDFAVDYRLRDQIHSAAVSIMSNIAEGFSRRTTKEFVQFLFVAKGSAAEVESQLYGALDQGYINREKFDDFYSKSDEVARLISGFIKYLLNKDKPHEPQERNKLKQLDELNKPEMIKELK